MFDDEQRGQLRPGEDLTIEAAPGLHTIYVTTDGRVRSPSLDLDLSSGDQVRVISSSPSNPIANLRRIIFRPGRTLEIGMAE